MATLFGVARTRTLAQDRTSVYLELTKARITFMVLLTVALGYVLAPVVSAPHAMLHVLLGAGLSCSGAGALNQYVERERDAVMARTRFRPLPARKVSPTTVLLFGCVLSIGGFAYLLVTTNALTAALDALTLVTYLFAYTPLKRVSSVCTLVGAVPGALPPVMGWAAACGRIDAGALALFGILFLWQIPHFLAIGRLYREDYDRGGFPMLVVIDKQGRIVGKQMTLYACALLPFSLALSSLGLAGPVYTMAAFLLGAAYIAFACLAAVRNDARSARNLLLASVVYLPLLFSALLLDGVIR
jgi:protoheme IX farnesyltransferase